MKKLGNDICDVVGGRAVHQIAAIVGGFTHLPERATAPGPAADGWTTPVADLEATVALFASLTMPEFDHPTEYLSLKSGAAYAYFGDLILSSNGDITPVRHYREKVKERVVAALVGEALQQRQGHVHGGRPGPRQQRLPEPVRRRASRRRRPGLRAPAARTPS